MKNTLAPALLLALASCSTVAGSSDTRWVDYGESPMENPEYMQDAMAAATPGAPHEEMKASVGTYDVEAQVWSGPGSEPMAMNGTSTMRMELDRYLVEEFQSEFMGMPFEGRLVQGYDNLTGKYWSLWYDSMSTGYSMSHGSEVEPGLVELRGTMRDVMTPEGRPMRMTVQELEDGNYRMRMYDTTQDGGEFMSMEMVYRRKSM